HIKKIAAQWHELHAQTLQKQSLAQAQDHLQNIQKKLSDLHKAQEKKLQLKELYLGLKEQEAAVLKIIETEFLEEKNKLTTHISVTQEQHKHLTQTLALKEKAYTQTLHKHHELSQKIEFVEKQKNELQKQCSIHTQEELTQKQLAMRSKQTEREHAHDLSVQLAQKQQQLDHPESCCPLCEQQLSQSRKKFLTSQCATEYEQLTQKVKLLDQEIVHAQEEIKSIHRAILQDETKKIELSTRDQELSLAKSLLEKESAQKQTLESEIAQIQTQCAQIAQTLQTLHQHAQILPTEFEQKKDATKALQAIHAEIEAVIAQGKAVPYNVQEHKTVQEQYESAQKTVHALENQHALINKKEELYSILQNLYQAIQTIQTEWHKKEVQKQAYQIDKLPGVHKEYTDIESQIKSVQQNIQSLIQEQNKQDVYKQKIEKIAQEKKELQAGIELQQKEMFDYQEIAKALGKDGIQALLIEEAIPEIENEANDLLSKLTNNQTHIFIESLRDLKKGGHKETLDIKIADNYGLRPYEMFSGGEAFRIDFALRIAISKLLARRAGANLQTLIIDEGFGSQDDEGLGLIMDCLTKIQDDFAKVIIISHLPLLKEQFPVQFLVQKQASGSVISVIEQG
ncbi:SMC family ATPase, partial [bacterium]|nr:SMC family ATPase [bacterium]